MTEQEWLACADPAPMFDVLSAEASERKLRLFGCACCRLVLDCFDYPRLAEAADWGERLADRSVDLIPPEVVDEVNWARGEYCETLNHIGEAVARTIDATTFDLIAGIAVVRDIASAFQVGIVGSSGDDQYAAQCDLLRDIFGNPFRPVVADPAWLTDTAMSLARQMYESRDFSAMPILADALQDAGCDNTDVLTHCRDAGAAHVRGCWVVDLVLGKQ